ncbi:DUF4394 domain-containing protein [Hymenobacter monticola]|uniref:DUF4394 domain-containing protein n=1 Tax=Hymenobacter monticola TaxID=1705399 RepID=A0ABY4B4K6_9BACT|nr:DUF4394 domain-containing protein [Hymenobacter monticola]UOE33945.1 DUF4394 domain-containing protein [Hymenobacter monticola]
MRTSFTALLLATAGLFGIRHQAQAQTVYALTYPVDVLSYSLLSFDAVVPGNPVMRGRVTGLVSNTYLVGLELRPATGQLLALGYESSLSQVRLYELNKTTGAATPLGPPTGLYLGNLSGGIGFSIDPTTDQIRVVTPVGNSYRLNAATGAMLAADASLAYAATDANTGQTPNIQAISYTNNYSGSPATQLFSIERTGSRLVQHAPSSASTLATVGPLGVSLPVNFDFGIAANSQSQTNQLYLMTCASTGQYTYTANWYRVNAGTGAATLVGTIGTPDSFTRIGNVAVPYTLVSATRDQADLATDLSVYPNPAAGAASLRFRLLRAAAVELRVTDALGRKMPAPPARPLAAGPQALRWETSGIRPGLYVVRLLVDGQLAAQRRVAVAD